MEAGFDEEEGRVVYYKKDGEISKVEPAKEVVLETLGFPLPRGESVHIDLGKKYEDDEIVVTVWSSSGSATNYYLKKDHEKAIRLASGAYRAIEDGELNIDNVMEYAADRPPEQQDPEDFTGDEGLEVVEQEGQYFIREERKTLYRVFDSLPEGWEPLAKGDGALTRAVKKEGPFWILYRYQPDRYGFRRQVQVGLCAPGEVIEGEFERLGGREGHKNRLKSKKKGMAKREKNLTEDFKRVMREIFPGMPENDVENTASRARSSGRVGRAGELYFATSDEKESMLRELVECAVKAHVRHAYTDYEEKMNETGEWTVDKYQKERIRDEIRPARDEKLDEWRQEHG